MSTTGRSTPRGGQDPVHAARQVRDHGLERGRTITKGVAAVSVAAVAAAGVYLSQALPGHDASSTSGTTATPDAGSAGVATPSDGSSPSDGGSPVVAPSDGGGSSSSSSAGSSSSGFSTPAQAPGPGYQQAPVTSGGS